MHKNIVGKKILITGGTGSLGKALTKRLVEQGNQVIIFSRDEGKQALIYGDKDVLCVIGDIRDFDKFNVTLKRTKPDIIIHTAALKRIDDMDEEDVDDIAISLSDGLKSWLKFGVTMTGNTEVYQFKFICHFIIFVIAIGCIV